MTTAWLPVHKTIAPIAHIAFIAPIAHVVHITPSSVSAITAIPRVSPLDRVVLASWKTPVIRRHLTIKNKSHDLSHDSDEETPDPAPLTGSSVPSLSEQPGGSEGGGNESGPGLEVFPSITQDRTGESLTCNTGESGHAPLPPGIARLGGLVVAFAMHSFVHGDWAAHIPLSSHILAATMLHLHCAHGVLTLRFETSDWDSRSAIERHSATLLARLRIALPTLEEVSLLDS